MKLYDYNNYNLFVVGDIHGEFKYFFNKIKSGTSKKNAVIEEEHPLLKNESNKKKVRVLLKDDNINSFYDNSVIVVAGDCGIGFNKEKFYIDLFSKYNEIFSKTNIVVLFVRGNHDDPSYFSEEKINFSNIKTIPDYSIVATKDGMSLCIGGAISIDRTWRKQQEAIINKYKKSYYKKLYWEDEQCVYNKELMDEIINSHLPINSIISHSSPKFALPKEKTNSINWFKIDANLNKDINDERKILTDIHKYLEKNGINIRFWCYGHFHINSTDYKSINKKKILLMALSDDFNISSPFQALHFIEEQEKIKQSSENKSYFKPLFWQPVDSITIGNFGDVPHVNEELVNGEMNADEEVDELPHEEVHEDAVDNAFGRIAMIRNRFHRNNMDEVRPNDEYMDETIPNPVNMDERVYVAPIDLDDGDDGYDMDDVDEAPF